MSRWTCSSEHQTSPGRNDCGAALPGVLVLEGCGSARREAETLVVLTVWVEAPPELRLERGLARDGEAARPHWERWMRDEAEHFARERTAERADVRLDAFGRMGA